MIILFSPNLHKIVLTWLLIKKSEKYNKTTRRKLNELLLLRFASLIENFPNRTFYSSSNFMNSAKATMFKHTFYHTFENDFLA